MSPAPALDSIRSYTLIVSIVWCDSSYMENEICQVHKTKRIYQTCL